MFGKKIVYTFLFFALLFSILYTKNADYNEDLGRHLALGKIIIQTHTIPKTNLFSYTNTNFPFTNHHWLSEAVFYSVHSVAGDSGLIFLKILVVGFALILVGFMALRKSNWPAVIFITSIVSFLLWSRTSVRPEIFGYALFAVVLWIVFFKRTSVRALLLFIPINIVWINMHITFVFALVIECMLLFFLLYKHRVMYKQNSRVLAVISGAIACFMVNPLGLLGILYPFRIFGNYGYTIAENQGIRFMMQYSNWIYYKYLFILLILGFIISVFFLFQKKFLESAVLFLFSSLACWQVRHAPFFALSAIFLMPQFVYGVVKNIRKFFPVSSVFFTITTCAVGAWVAFLLLSNTYSNVFLHGTERGFGQSEQYSKGISFMQQKRLPKQIFNNFDIGGYIIYRSYPHYEVFVDNRPEAYPAQFFDVYKNVQTNRKIRKEKFVRYNIHTIIFSHTDQTEWARTFIHDLFQDSDWKLVYLDPYMFIMTDIARLDIRGENEDRLFENLVAKTQNSKEILNYYILFSILEKKNMQEVAMNKLMKLAPQSCTVQKRKYFQFNLLNSEYYLQLARSLRSDYWYCF